MARVTYNTKKLLKELSAEVARVSDAVLERAGDQTVEILQSYSHYKEITTSMRGAPHTFKLRRVHPGEWGDRSGNLVDSYGFRVDRTARGLSLTVYNTARHAHLLEALDGYFVVRGIFDKGEFGADELKKAVLKLAPGWKWKS